MYVLNKALTILRAKSEMTHALTVGVVDHPNCVEDTLFQSL